MQHPSLLTFRLPVLVLSFSLFLSGSATNLLADEGEKTSPALSVYFPDYRYSKGMKLALYGSTHLILFSAKPNEDGSVDFSRITPGLLELAQRARLDRDIKVTFCVGGWGRGKLFATAVGNPESRARFVAALGDFCAAHALDGVDIDWEFPKGEQEHADFTLFLKDLSTRLHANGRHLSVALGYTRPLSPECYSYIDQVNLMSYQPWNPPSPSYDEWLSDAVEKMLASGLPPEKLLLGVGFFAKEYGGKRRAISFKTLADPKKGGLPESEHGFSPVGQAACDLRIELVKKHGLGGLMVWDYGHDASDPVKSLLRYLTRQLSSIPGEYPAPASTSGTTPQPPSEAIPQ